MPLYMDAHAGLGDATPEDVAAAHQRDLEVQGKYGVRFLTYWLNNPDGRAYCLVELRVRMQPWPVTWRPTDCSLTR